MDNRQGDFILHREDVRQFPIVCLRPHVRVGPGIDQLCGNAHLVARLTYRAFENMCDVEAFRDLRDLNILALERES